ncbi:hypothetical protein [Kitasatospora sp. NPDC092286]|uniref:hypothetical protein n=1 Tax=Kitasatospora sp. NPDC092286 TaxID=3364087 RepID=UPI00381B30DB
MPGPTGTGFKVTAVAGSSARVSIAAGRAWVPLTRAGVRDTRHSALVELPSPGVTINLGPSSPTADRFDLIVARVAEDTDTTPYSEVPLSNYVPGNMSPGWAVDVVRGVDGAPSPGVPYESYLILARVRVRRNSTTLVEADIEDLRYATTGQGDPTVLAPIRTAPGQSLAAAAGNQSRGGLIYATDEDRLYLKTATDARPLANRPQYWPWVTGKGATGWWAADVPGGGTGRVLWFDGPAVPYDRIAIVSYQMRYTVPAGREGWTSCWVSSAGAFGFESIRSYTNVGGQHTGTAQLIISKNAPLSVYLYLYGQLGFCQFDDWQSGAQMTAIPAE